MSLHDVNRYEDMMLDSSGRLWYRSRSRWMLYHRSRSPRNDQLVRISDTEFYLLQCNSIIRVVDKIETKLNTYVMVKNMIGLTSTTLLILTVEGNVMILTVRANNSTDLSPILISNIRSIYAVTDGYIVTDNNGISYISNTSTNGMYTLRIGDIIEVRDNLIIDGDGRMYQLLIHDDDISTVHINSPYRIRNCCRINDDDILMLTDDRELWIRKSTYDAYGIQVIHYRVQSELEIIYNRIIRICNDVLIEDVNYDMYQLSDGQLSPRSYPFAML